MKYAGKTFTLYASEPVAVQGSDSLYTYQNTGTGTATIVGSNNAVNWTTVATVASGASHTGSHAYAFLMMTGSTEVSVSRGAAGDNSFSSSNPLPVVSKLDSASSSTQGALSGVLSKCWINCPAVSAKYSAVQIWNPVGSGVDILIIGVAGYNSSTSMKWYQHLSSEKLSTLGGFQTPMKTNSPALPIEMYSQNLDAKTATNALGVTVGATTPDGGSLQLTGENICITEGYGLKYEADTANIGITMTAHIIASPNT